MAVSLNYVVDVQPLEDGVRTDADIATALSSSGLSAKVVKISSLRRLLRDEELLFEAARGGWGGPLLDLVDGDPDPLAVLPEPNRTGLRNGISKFVRHVCHRDTEEFDLTNAVYAAEFKTLCEVLAIIGVMDHSVCDAIYALGGGEKYEGVVEADVTAARNGHNLESNSAFIANLFDEARMAAVNAAANGQSIEDAKAAGLAVVNGEV